MSPEPFITLHHGTTRRRAERIVARGPDARFAEPGGNGIIAERFATAYAVPPRPRFLGHPEDYARLKASNFPNEGGPVILEIDVREWIVMVVADEVGAGAALSGEVAFHPDAGLPELQAAWPTIPKRIIPL